MRKEIPIPKAIRISLDISLNSSHKEKGDQIPTFAAIQFEIKSINFIEEAGCEGGNLKSSQRGQIKNETLAQKYDFKSKVSINFIEEGNLKS